MSVKPYLEIKQKPSQGVTLTPQLQMAIRLLQLNHIELQALVTQELNENPFLEMVEEQLEPTENGVEGEADEPQPLDFDADPEPYSDSALQTSEEFAVSHEAQENMSQTTSQKLSESSSFEKGNNEEWISQVHSPKTLTLHLEEQIYTYFHDPLELKIAQHLLRNLDETGYFLSDTQEISTNLAVEHSQVLNVLAILKTFDPAGVFAQDLKECLTAQLKEQGLLDESMIQLMAHLEWVGNNAWDKLCRLLKIDQQTLGKKIKIIKSLSPKPGLLFDAPVSQSIIPDVYVWYSKEGIWQVDLNMDTLPKVFINQDYYHHIRQQARNPEDKKYFYDRFQSANWLVKSLAQRATTLLRVSQEIIRLQENFFAFGMKYLKPMVLRDVAQNLGLHESTISRVTNGKYMSTPRGIFELKFFFTSALSAKAPNTNHVSHLVSGEAVRFRIQELIKSESPAEPLSDEVIADHLNKEGILVARRTVAKYREAMGIVSSPQRKRLKNFS